MGMDLHQVNRNAGSGSRLLHYPIKQATGTEGPSKEKDGGGESKSQHSDLPVIQKDS